VATRKFLSHQLDFLRLPESVADRRRIEKILHRGFSTNPLSQLESFTLARGLHSDLRSCGIPAMEKELY